MSKKEKKESLNNSTIYDRLFDVKSLVDIKQLKKDLNSRLGMNIFGMLIGLLGLYTALLSGAPWISVILLAGMTIGANLSRVLETRLIKDSVLQKEKQISTSKKELEKEETLPLKHATKVIEKEETLPLKHTTKVVEKKDDNMTFDDFIKNANSDQLKQQREYLACYQNVCPIRKENVASYDEQPVDIDKQKYKTKVR